MIKNGKVILNNDACIVVDVDGVEVQLPPVLTSSELIQLDCTNGVYSLVRDEESEVVDDEIAVEDEVIAEVDEIPAEDTKKKRRRSRKKDSEVNDTPTVE